MRFRVMLLGLVGSLAISIASAAAEDKLRFVTLEFAPFIYGENKQVAGPGRDVIAAACQKAGISCTYDIYPWRRAQALMKSGDADGMMVIGRNPKRETWLNFSPPLFRTEYGLFVRTENTVQFGDLGQIAGFRIGVFAPSNTAVKLESIRQEMIAQGLAPITIKGHPEDSAGMRKLAAGRLDAVYSNRDRGWGILRTEKLGSKIRYAGQHKAILYYAGITKSYARPQVVARFFEAWRGLYANGEAQRMIKGYGLEPAPHQ